MSNERVDQRQIQKRLNKVNSAFTKMDRVVNFEETPNLNRPLESLTQLSGVDRITQAAELAQRRMALQSTLNQIYEEKAKPVLTSQMEKLQSQLAAETKLPPINSIDQTEAAVLASLILSRDGTKIKQEEGISYEFDLPTDAKFICHELVNNFSSPTRIPLDQLAIIRSDVIKKVSAIVDGGNRDDIGNQEPLVKDLLTELCAQVQDEFNGYFGQFLTESPTLIGRSYRSVVEPETVERFWILPKRNGSGHAKADNVITEPVRPQEARADVEAEAEKQLPTIKVNLETHEIQLEGWAKPKKIGSKIDWAVFQGLVDSLNRGEDFASSNGLTKNAWKAGSYDFNAASNAIFRLRKITERHLFSPRIIETWVYPHESENSTRTWEEFLGYRLYAQVEFVNDMKGPKPPEQPTDEDTDRAIKLREARKTFEVALPDGQIAKIRGKQKAKTLEKLVDGYNQEHPIKTDELAIYLYGRYDHLIINRVYDLTRRLRKDILSLNWNISQPIQPRERMEGQIAQYSLVKAEEDIKTKKTIVSKETEEQFPTLKINLYSKEVQLEGWETAKLFQGVISWAILVHLGENAGRTIPKEVLQNLAKEYGSHSDAAVKTAVFELRRLIEPDPKDPQVIVTSRSGKETHYSLKAQVEFVREEPKLLSSEEQKKVEAGHYYDVELPEGSIARIKGKIKSHALKILVQAAREGKPIRVHDFSYSLYGNLDKKTVENSRQVVKDLKKDLEEPGYRIKKLGKRSGIESYFSLEKVSVDAQTSPNSTGTSDSKTRQETGIVTVLPKEEATQPEIETQSISSLRVEGQDQLIASQEAVAEEFSSAVQELIDSGFLSKEELKLLNDNSN